MNNTRIVIVALLLCALASIGSHSNACTGQGVPPEATGTYPDSERADASAETDVNQDQPADNKDGTEPEPEDVIDPVLLKTGEFTFKRKDALVGGASIAFPIVRTYRSRPAGLTRNLIGDGDVKQISDEPTSNPNEWYNNPEMPQWTSWGLTIWKKPPIDRIYFRFRIKFEIIPVQMSGGQWVPDPGVGGFEMIDALSDPDLIAFAPCSQQQLSFMEGKAYRFRLWTGQSYMLQFSYEKEYCPWECLCGLCAYMYPNLQCLQQFCPAFPLSDFLPYPDWDAPYDSTVEYIYRCGFHTDECSWYDPSPSTAIITIPRPPIVVGRIPQPIPSQNSCPLSGDIGNCVSLTNWTPGWDMSYNIHVDYVPDPNTENSIDERQIHLYPGSGNMSIYQASPDPIYGEIWTCSKRNDFLVKWPNGTYTLYQKQNCYWQFNNKGYIDYISEKDQTITFGYDPNVYGLNDTLRLNYIQDNVGRRVNLFYTEPNGLYPGNLLKIVDHTGREWQYDYYPDGNLQTATDPNGYTETYEYDDWGRLTVVKNDDGDTWLHNDYDEYGRVESQVYGGRTSTIEYTEDGGTVTDPNGVFTTYVLNEDGYSLSRTQQTDTGSATTSYERNSQNQLTQIAYPEENGYDLRYDGKGNLEEVAVFSNDPADPNLTYTLTYTNDDWSFIKTITDPLDHTTTYTYDYEDAIYDSDSGLLMKITYPQVLTDQGLANPEVHFTYDPNNRLETVTEPNGIVLKYEYCADAEEPNTLGLIKRVILDYGDPNDPDFLNVEYNFDYDSTGRIVDVNDPFGNKTTLTYNVLNLLQQVENPNHNITKFRYDADKNLTGIDRAYQSGWQTSEYGYNILDQLQTITDTLGRTTTLEYDDRHLLKQVTDANQNATQRKYNKRSLLKEIIDAEDGSTALTYEDNGKLSIAADAEDANTVYEYDGYGRLEFVRYANQSYEQYGYDSASNLTSFRNRAGQTIIFEYDALNRLIGKTRPNETKIVLTYDIAGRVVDVSRGASQMSFEYDRLGRRERTIDQNGYEVGYEYDDMGRRTKLEYPDGSYITYEYDNTGQLEYIKDQNSYPIVRYYYDELSRKVLVEYFCNGSYVGGIGYDYEDKVAASGDNLGSRIERIDYYGCENHSISYTYDAVGNVLTTDVESPVYEWSYGYDDIYQVEDAEQAGRSIYYGYDSVYNRTYWSDSDLGFLTYTDNALNQYTTVGSGTPSYDSRGNMTSGYGGAQTLTYDCENRLVSASGSTNYGYDLLGRRISRTDRYGTVVYVWDGAQIIAEYTNGELSNRYVYGPGLDSPVMMSGGWERYYFSADALGSIRLLTDTRGYVVESYTYDPYGEPYVMNSPGPDGNWLSPDTTTYWESAPYIDNPYMFTGRQWDSTTRLYYYRMRDYSPDLGRFLQPDPAGYIDTMNLYAYCGNNPMNWIDPWGLLPTQEHERIHKGDGALDSGWTHPWLPWATLLHFRERNDVDRDLREAVRNQDRSDWNALKHMGEDTFSHNPGISGVIDHILNPNLDNDAMKNGAGGPGGFAEQWSDDWEYLYNKNPSLNDLANAGEQWMKCCPK